MSENSNTSQTFGQRAVGLSFNPSGDSKVDKIKRLSADLIDALDDLRADAVDSEVKRMAALAITNVQQGQMWGVKAATWK